MVKLTIVAGFAGVLALGACGSDGSFDPDLRGFMRGGLNTADAARSAPARPAPDARGVITFSNSQVAVARQGDTVATVAARLGLNAAELAQYNALQPATALQEGAVLALPRRVAAGAPVASTRATGVVSSTGQVSDPFAGQGVRQTNVPGALISQQAPASDAAPAASTQAPRQHVVASGETAWSIARKYGITVTDLAEWNGLAGNMTVRVGQRLIIPAPGTRPGTQTATISAPGAGSPTPQPPSAAQPLPNEKTQPASAPVAKPAGPDLGATRTAASGNGRFSMPVGGSIIRAYSKGKNDGIDISAGSGTPVKAAGAGTVAAITRDTSGTPIVVVRHGGDLMTVYAGLDDLSVSKGDSVSAGQAIGKATSSGVVHFEVRRGFESVDPESYL